MGGGNLPVCLVKMACLVGDIMAQTTRVAQKSEDGLHLAHD